MPNNIDFDYWLANLEGRMCIRCHKPFATGYHWQIYCSRTCETIYNKRRRAKLPGSDFIPPRPDDLA